MMKDVSWRPVIMVPAIQPLTRTPDGKSRSLKPANDRRGEVQIQMTWTYWTKWEMDDGKSNLMVSDIVSHAQCGLRLRVAVRRTKSLSNSFFAQAKERTRSYERLLPGASLESQ